MGTKNARFTRFAGFVALLVALGAAPAAQAETCRDLGGIYVAAGALVGGGVILVASLVGPAVAVAHNNRQSFWEGFGWSMLGGVLGVGAGSFIAFTTACEHGTWLPGTLGLGGSIVSIVLWSEPAGPGQVTVGVEPLVGGLGLNLGGRF
jgi:hypothetical protein